MAGMAMDEATPPEKLLPPLVIAGLGNSSITITTSNTDAQRWFSQGLNELHDFWDFESARAFEQSVRVDPNCAMCYWGLDKAEAFRGENDGYAAAALKQAEKLAKHATPTEKLYIQAAKEEEKETLAEEKQSKERNQSAWQVTGVAEPHIDSRETKVLRNLVAQQDASDAANDIQAKIFLAESLIDGFDKQAVPKPGTAEAQAILAAILAAHPDDSAANHYWIHAQEPGQHPDAALPSARKLGSLAPASGPTRCTCLATSSIAWATTNPRAPRLKVAFASKRRTCRRRSSVDDNWNYVHNLMYLIADLLEAGRMDEATAMSAKLNGARGGRVTTLTGAVHATTWRAWIRCCRSRCAPPTGPAPPSFWNEQPARRSEEPGPDARRTAGLRPRHGSARRGRRRRRGEVLQVAGRRRCVRPVDPPMSMPGMLVSKDVLAVPVHSFMDVAAEELHAALLMAQGKTADADAAFAKATTAETALGYREPPYYIRQSARRAAIP